MNHKEEKIPFEFKMISYTLMTMVGVSWLFAVIPLFYGKLFVMPAYMVLVFMIAAMFFFPKTIKPKQMKIDEVFKKGV